MHAHVMLFEDSACHVQAAVMHVVRRCLTIRDCALPLNMFTVAVLHCSRKPNAQESTGNTAVSRGVDNKEAPISCEKISVPLQQSIATTGVQSATSVVQVRPASTGSF